MDESQVEELTIGYLKGLGSDYVHGPEIAPATERPERRSYGDVILAARLKAALDRINPR